MRLDLITSEHRSMSGCKFSEFDQPMLISLTFANTATAQHVHQLVPALSPPLYLYHLILYCKAGAGLFGFTHLFTTSALMSDDFASILIIKFRGKKEYFCFVIVEKHWHLCNSRTNLVNMGEMGFSFHFENTLTFPPH